MSETSQRWAQFRFAVVGHLVFSGIEKGKLAPQLKSLSAKKWKHPISGKWRGAAEPHYASSSSPGETGREKLFINLHTA